MARAVIGGLITSTLLTLVVIPVVYTLVDDVGSRVSGKLTRAEREHRRKDGTAGGAAPAA
jgi:HAE1 family hydrophobic/amphiphilic exporter-1